MLRINLETHTKLKCEHSVSNKDMTGNSYFCLFIPLVASAQQGLTSLMVSSLKSSALPTLSLTVRVFCYFFFYGTYPTANLIH